MCGMHFRQVACNLGISYIANDLFFDSVDRIIETDPDFIGNFFESIYGDSHPTLKTRYLENYASEIAIDVLVEEALAKGSTAVVRRCNDCGRVLHVLIIPDRSSPGEVRVECEDGVFFGRCRIDDDMHYEKWLCADVGSFEVEHGFRCSRAEMARCTPTRPVLSAISSPAGNHCER